MSEIRGFEEGLLINIYVDIDDVHDKHRGFCKYI